MHNFFETVAQHFANKLPFVVYRKPNSSVVKAILQKDAMVHYVKTFEESGFVFAPFEDKAKSVLFPLDRSELISISEVLTVKEKDAISVTFKGNKEDHVNLVKKGIEAIKEGTFQKVVLSRREEVVVNDVDPILILKRLLKSYASAFVYCWYHPKVGLWLGATPETFLKVEGSQFSMMSLAGTQNYNGTLEVEWEAKERQEQQYVTDFILDNITSEVDDIKISETETIKAGNLVHLRTLIKGELDRSSLDFKALLDQLHPTPAVCGLPKEQAMRFILDNETYDREFYTGFLGELNSEINVRSRHNKRNIENRAYTFRRKATQLYVNLRCMQIKDKTAFIYVGGGITATSIAEKEWEETVAKSKVMKKVL